MTVTVKWLLLVFSVLALSFILMGCGPKVEPEPESQVVVNTPLPDYLYFETDKDTGCQYIIYPGSGITPRLGRGGTPICETTTMQ